MSSPLGPLGTVLGLLAHGDLIQEAKKEVLEKYTALNKEWEASGHDGSSPGNELTITFSGENKISRVVIKPDVDTSNKSLVELLVLTAMNEAIKAHQLAYDELEAKRLTVEKEVIEKYEAILKERQSGTAPKLPDVPVDGNVMQWTDIVARNKAKDSKKD